MLAGNPPGRAIVTSAGNEANEKLHAHATVAGSSELEVPFDVKSKTKENVWLDLWYEPPGQLQARVVAPDGTTLVEYVGMAPEADIICVKLRHFGKNMKGRAGDALKSLSRCSGCD